MIKAVTIDFWNTIADTSNGDERRRRRNAALHEALHAHGVGWDDERIAAGMKHTYTEFERIWFGERRTPDADESVRALWRFLEVSIAEEWHSRVVRAFEDSILHGPPGLLPGAAIAIEELAAAYPLALISDTAFSPGRALRSVLELHGIARHFTAMVFSDETGVSKPHPDAFEIALAALRAPPESAVHIGDIERTDIAGSLGVGMKAVLFRGDTTASHFNADAPTQAHAVAWNWDTVPGIIRGLGGV